MPKPFKYRYRIPWICNEDETEFFAHIGSYDLRAKKIGSLQWWFSVSFEKKPIETQLDDHATCQTQALTLAEGVYVGHMAAIEAYNQTYVDFITRKLQAT
jgi:hypothetical protein